MSVLLQPRDPDYATFDALARRFETGTKIEPDPVIWAKNDLKVDLYSRQREILRLLEFVPKLAVPSCHDSGKSFLAALATARFLTKHPPGTARVVSTAPTNDQVRAILWNEINSLHSRAANVLPGRVNQTEWWIGSYMAGIGRKPSDYAPETFQGLHAEHILVIIDEAGAVPDALWTGVDTLTTNAGARILAIGNPTDPLTEFKRVVDEAETVNGNGWAVVRITAWDTPNLSGEQVPALLGRVLLSSEWVEDKRKKWGEESPFWKSRVCADFPDESQMTVIRLSDVRRAQLPDDEPRPDSQLDRLEQVQLGVDVAASDTGDETQVRERRGRRVLRRWSVQSSEPEDVSDLIVQAQAESGASLVHVDATGVGFGFLSDVRRRVPEVAVLPFVAAARAKDPVQYENRRAEAHWEFRERLRRNELDLSEMENGDEVLSQLLSVRYTIKKGRILVEPKEEVRRRIGRSPDDADALLLAVLPPLGSGAPAPASARASTLRRRRDGEAAKRREPRKPATAAPRAVPERVVVDGEGRTRRSLRARVRLGDQDA